MNFEKINNSQWDMNYASVSFVIQWINSTGHLDIVDMGWSKNLILRRLTAVIKTQFISPTNQIYEKYLVKNTHNIHSVFNIFQNEKMWISRLT